MMRTDIRRQTGILPTFMPTGVATGRQEVTDHDYREE